MPSVVGLLEERELAARERVEGLREEADRVLAALAEAESDWEGWVIARQRVGQVLTALPGQDAAIGEDAVLPVGGSQPRVPAVPAEAGVPAEAAEAPSAVRTGSVVPVWRPGLEAGVLAADYQRILAALARREAGDEAVMMTCQEIMVASGLEPVSAKVEGVRSRAKRLADRGWLEEPVPGRFTLAAGPAAAS